MALQQYKQDWEELGSSQRQRKRLMNKSPSTIRFVTPKILSNIRLPKTTRRFIKSHPFTRLTILALVQHASNQLHQGMNILDVGAGDCPYKSLFSHVEYKSTDFAQTTEHHAYQEIDYICPADALPVSEKSFDAILCTEVLEHVSHPQKVLTEFHRVLKQGGQLFVTTPFLFPLHEEPYDFYRYTPYALKQLLQETGFEVVFLTSRGGWVATVASTLGRDILRPSRENVLAYGLFFLPLFALPILLMRIIPPRMLAWLDKTLDKEQKYTLGYAFHAIKVD
jgi:SAM-dependent methyltransferase